jgi:hypothetical protein
MPEFYISFGVRYSREEHPGGAVAHPDGYWRITAFDENVVREFMHETFENKYAFIYDEKPEARWFPRGELKHITVGQTRVVYQFAFADLSGIFVDRDGVTALDGQGWAAMADDGTALLVAASSSREWGIHDTSLEFEREHYVKLLGTDDVVNVVLPENRNGVLNPELFDKYVARLKGGAAPSLDQLVPFAKHRGVFDDRTVNIIE